MQRYAVFHIAGLSVVAAGLFSPSVSRAVPPQPEYSLTERATAPNGSSTVKVYVSGEKSRVEILDPGRESIMINLPGKTWFLNPAKRTAFAMPNHFDKTDNAPPSANPCLRHKDWTCTLLGTEAVAGRPAVKWRIQAPNGDGPHRSREMLEWRDAQYHLPLKQVWGKHSMTISDLHWGPQPPGLFKVPSGYRVMNSQ